MSKNKIEELKRIQRTRDSLKIQLGVLIEKKKDVAPVLEKYKCKTPNDIKRAIKRLKLERAAISERMTDLAERAESIKEKLEEKFDE